MSVSPVLIVFHGGMGGSPLEDAVSAARRAAALDTIDRAWAAGIRRAVVLTDDAAFDPEREGVEIVAGGSDHHFGRELAQIIRERKLRSVIYLGGGSLPFLGAEHFREIVAKLESSIAVTNNRFSSDLIAWNADSAGLNLVEAQARDNSLARALQESGVQMWEQPRTLETAFDIDGPADLTTLAITGLGGPRLRSAVEQFDIGPGPYRRLLPLLVDRTAEVLVAGRLGSHVWQYLERETACRVRVFAEERGLEADERPKARSVLGFLYDAAGPDRFFEVLTELGDAAVIDTRVLLAHRGEMPDRADRFLSDAGRWKEIRDPFLRELTAGAASARVPVLLGGHSLVTGDLMALNEFAWQQSEAGIL